MKVITVHLSDDDYEKLVELAKKKGLTPTNLAKRIVLEAIRNAKEKSK